MTRDIDQCSGPGFRQISTDAKVSGWVQELENGHLFNWTRDRSHEQLLRQFCPIQINVSHVLLTVPKSGTTWQFACTTVEQDVSHMSSV